jgi:hypothetical protein
LPAKEQEGRPWMRRMPPAMDAQGKIDLEIAGDGFFP